MSRDASKLVLGRGEVYFDRFLPNTRTGEGERYIGNTPAFRIQSDIERLQRATSYGGLKVMQRSAVTSESHTVNFTTDKVDPENLAMWFGDNSPTTFNGHDRITETLVVRKGRFYQLGTSLIPVVGTRNVTYEEVRYQGVLLPAATNYRLDQAAGRLEILPTSSIPDGGTITVRFAGRSGLEHIIESRPTPLVGTLRYVSRNINPLGQLTQVDYVFPYVEITPRGQIDLKSDEWQQWTFEAKAFNLSPLHRQLYVTHRAESVGLIPDEAAIVAEFGSLAAFPYWEERLRIVTNIDWPPALSNMPSRDELSTYWEYGADWEEEFRLDEGEFHIEVNERWSEAIGSG